MKLKDLLILSDVEAKPIPDIANQDELTQRQQELGDLLRELDRLTVERGQAVADALFPTNKRLTEIGQEIFTRAEAIEKFATENRELLTNQERTKTINHPGGSFSWRKTTELLLPEGKAAIAELIQKLKRKRLKRFVRTKEELDKAGIKRARELFEKRAVEGITFKDGEILSIQPIGTVGISRRLDDPQWEIEESESQSKRRKSAKDSDEP